MNVLEKLKAAIVRFIGIEDDPHDCPDPLAEACDPLGECSGCKLLEEVIAERDGLLAKAVAPPPAADNFMALKCRQVKPPEPLRPRYAMFYITMDLLAITLLYILRSTEKTVYESIGTPCPAIRGLCSLFATVSTCYWASCSTPAPTPTFTPAIRFPCSIVT